MYVLSYSIAYEYLKIYCIVQYYSSYTIYQHNTGHWQKYVWNVATITYAYQKDSSSCGVFVMKVYIM